MACIIELDTARHYRDLDRRDRAAMMAEQMRPELVMEWITDMDKRTEEHIELVKLLANDDPDFMDALFQCAALYESRVPCSDTLKAFLAEKIGGIIWKRADAMVGGDLEDEKFQELVREV